MTDRPKTAGTGVLLVNLGTPAAPTPGAIRRFLSEFLRDRRVVRLPRVIWYPILFGFILPFRPKRLAEAYGKIWSSAGSPLLAISQRLADSLRSRLAGTPVALGMRYGSPSIGAALEELRARGVSRLLVLPLYPQFSTTTTSSVEDALAQASIPHELIRDYHDDGGYIAALAASVREYWTQHGRGKRLLISFHSIPQQYVDEGDPYREQCEATARLLAEALHLRDGEWFVSYQSRLGRAPWLQPYTDVVLREWAAQKIGDIDVIAPGFSADCLETLEEIAIRYRDAYLQVGGGKLRYIPALNDDPRHVEALAGLLRGRLDAGG